MGRQSRPRRGAAVIATGDRRGSWLLVVAAAAGLLLAGCGAPADDAAAPAEPGPATPAAEEPAPADPDGDEAAAPGADEPEEATEPDQDADGAPDGDIATDPSGPLAFTATTVEGDVFDGAALDGLDVALWFWAPW